MAVRQRLFALVAAVLLAVLTPTQAFAAVSGPVFVPETLLDDGFESASSSNYSLEPLNPISWGRTAFQKKAGSWGMWVAGSPNAPTSATQSYAEDSRGYVTLTPPVTLANYYSSQLAFQLIQPSVGYLESTAGGNDSAGLYVKTRAAVADTNRLVPFKSVVSAWSLKTVNLSDAAAGANNLSRSDGKVWFDFRDGDEVPGRTPRVGVGPTIDDVKITAWKYGAPRDVAASVFNGSSVRIDFKKPLRRTSDTTTTEDRSIVYRIWRTSNGGSTYVDVSGDPDGFDPHTTSASKLDPIVQEGVTLTYVVQAWDTASGPGYGMPVTAQVAIPAVAPAVALTAPTSATSASNAPLLIKGTATDVGSGIETVTVSVRRANGQYYNGSEWVASGAPVYLPSVYDPVTTQFTASIPGAAADIAYTVTAKATDASGLSSTASVLTQSSRTTPALAITTKSQTLTYATAVSGVAVSGTLKNGSAALAGRTVNLESAVPGGAWTTVATGVTGSTGSVTFVKKKVPTKAYFRIRFDGDESFLPAQTGYITFDPKAELARPWATYGSSSSSVSTFYKTRTYTWRTNVKPHHTAGGRPSGDVSYFEIEKYSSGKWRDYGSKVTAVTYYDYSSYSRARVSKKITSAGKYRVRFYHNDAGHAATASTWRYITVK